MPLNRREFLGPLFAAPIFIASGAWVPRGHGAREAESPLEDGLAFMRRTGVLGAVIVVPRSPKGRRQLGRALHRLADPVSDPRTGVRAEGDAWVDIGRGDRESLAVMTSVAIICLERRDAKARFEAPGCIIAIDEEARPLRSIDE
ncbi:MAG: hypothetical protein KDB53_00195, partial [Planctomycetes bacterium]|nr:hypothetical protein [Planctomycetota bacterium]